MAFCKRVIIKGVLGIMAERFNAAVLKTVYLIGTFVRIKLIPILIIFISIVLKLIWRYASFRLLLLMFYAFTLKINH